MPTPTPRQPQPTPLPPSSPRHARTAAGPANPAQTDPASDAPSHSVLQQRLQGAFLTIIGLAGLIGGVLFSIEAPRFTPVPVVFLTFWLVMVVVGKILFAGLGKLRETGVGAPAPSQVRAAAAVAGIVVAVGMMGFAATTGVGAGAANAVCPGDATCPPGPGGPTLTFDPPTQTAGGQQGNQGGGQQTGGNTGATSPSPAGSGGDNGPGIQAQTPQFGTPGQQAPNIPGNEQPGQGGQQPAQGQQTGQQNPVRTTAPGRPDQTGQQQSGQPTQSGHPSSPTVTVTKTESQCAVPGAGNGAGVPGSPGSGDSSNNGGSTDTGPDNGDGEKKDGAPSWAYLVGEVSALMTGRRGRKAGPLNADGSAPTNDMTPNDQVDGENYKEWTTPDGKRTFILSENADAPSQYRFNINEVDRPEGGSVDVNDDGSLSTYDRDGNEVNRFTPWAYDTVTGEKIPTSYTRDGDDLVQTIDRPEGNNNPILADPPGDDETPGRGGASGEGADNSSPEPAQPAQVVTSTPLSLSLPRAYGPYTQEQLDQQQRDADTNKAVEELAAAARARERAVATLGQTLPQVQNPDAPTDPMAPVLARKAELEQQAAEEARQRAAEAARKQADDVPAAAGDPRPSELAQRDAENTARAWNDVLGAEGEQYKKFFPKDVYPVEKTTSVHNGVYTTKYRMSDGSSLSQVEDNGGEYPAYWDRIDDSPALGSGRIDVGKGTVTRDYTGAQILTTTLDNIDTALSFVPPLKPEGAAVKGIAKGVRAATGTPKERETVNVGDKVLDKPDVTPPVKPDVTPPVKPDVTPPVKPQTPTLPPKPEGAPPTRLTDGQPAPGNLPPKIDPNFNPPKEWPAGVGRLPSGKHPSNGRWAGHTYDFRNSPKPVRDELLKKYPDGVRFTSDGFPDFGPYSIRTIELPGGFKGHGPDEIAANKIAGFDKNNPIPDGYVWHHNQDLKTMQLVPKDLHNIAVRHAGGNALRPK
ncbi:hypothetical protein GCM10009648_28410 [Tsukamurella spumae]